MSDINIEVAGGTSIRLLTAGKYCDKNIVITASGGEADSRLPPGYIELTYIQSTGTQYIDTGFKPNQDTRITCKAKVAIGSKTNWLLSAGGKFYFAGSRNGYYVSGYNSKAVSFSTECNTNEAFTVDANKSVWTFMSDTVGDTVEHTYANFSCDSNLLLFAYLVNSSLTCGSVSIYSCKIYDNGTLVRDFVPCQTADDEVGLYDLVNDVFYANKGTGKFVGGELVNSSEYPIWTGGYY
jgi:hypothetical protein